MDAPTVTLRVPPLADHLALLRTVVGGVAAREQFTLEQVDDLRMAVEEAAVQLLRRNDGSPLVLQATVGLDKLELDISTGVSAGEPVFDPTSFSWMILDALSDDLVSDSDGSIARLRLTKQRTHEPLPTRDRA